MSLKTACMAVRGSRVSRRTSPSETGFHRPCRTLLRPPRCEIVDGQARERTNAWHQCGLVNEESWRVVRRCLRWVRPLRRDAKEEEQPRHFLFVQREVLGRRRL